MFFYFRRSSSLHRPLQQQTILLHYPTSLLSDPSQTSPTTATSTVPPSATSSSTHITKSSAEHMFVGRSLNGRVVSLLNDDPNAAAAAQLGLPATHPHQLGPASHHHHHHQHQHQHQATVTTTHHLSPHHQQQSTQFNGPQLSAQPGINHQAQQHQQASPTNTTAQQQQQQQQPSAPGGAGASLPPPLPLPNGTVRVPNIEKKRNHVCTTCSKAFTTSGHLARHIRVHTGERNHKCPFPGCETRCSRQDNLQQQ